MQVTETVSEGLKRELKVVVKANELEKQLMNKLAELKHQIRIKGFRPGKVPVAHLRKVHGRAVMAEVVQESINETSLKALEERDERPASQPEISLSEDKDVIERLVTGKGDLDYTMTFEVVPKFDLMDFSKIRLEREVADGGVFQAGGDDGGELGVRSRAGKPARLRGTPVPLSDGSGFEDAPDGEVDRLGAAAGEDEFAGEHAEEGGKFLAGQLHGAAGLLAGAMDARRVGKEGGGGDVGRLGCGGAGLGGGVVVEVDHGDGSGGIGV